MILKEYLSLNFEYRNNNFFELIENEKNKYFDMILNKNLKKEENDKTLYEDFSFKYNFHFDEGTTLSLNSWFEIITKSYLDIKKINKEIYNSKYYYDENISTWKRLTSYFNLKDKEFDELLKDVFIKFKENKYVDYFQNKLIASMLLFFNEERLFDINSNELMNICKMTFKRLFEQNQSFLKKIVFNTPGRFFMTEVMNI